MRTALLIALGVAAWSAATYFQPKPEPVPAPFYVNGKPVLADPKAPPAPDRGPEEAVAAAAHRATLDAVSAALDRPWTEMCGAEQRRAVAAAMNTYFADRARFARHEFVVWLRDLKRTGFDWTTHEDKRIERLARVSFTRQYFTLRDLDAGVAAQINDMVRMLPVEKECDSSVEPWRLQEAMHNAGRDHARSNVVSALRQPRSCTPQARRLLSYDVGGYFEQRVDEQIRLIEWGGPGLRYGTAVWDTAADHALEERTRQLVREGYLAASDIRPKARALFESLFGDIVPGNRCAGVS